MVASHTLLRAILAGLVSLSAPMASLAAELPAEVAAKVEKATRRMTELAADPSVVAAVREANGTSRGAMDNGKWSELTNDDPAVKAILSTKVSAFLIKTESADNAINKLVLRDRKGNLVAASIKPLLFNNANRQQFANAMKGQAWYASDIKQDITTLVPSVQIGVPVFEASKVIGVLHGGVTAQ